MAKATEHITFTRQSRNRYTTVSEKTGQPYVLTLGDDNRATCTCQGWAFRQACKHSRELERTALFEPLGKHEVRVRDNEPGTNFRVECTCGFLANVATLNRGFADEVAQRHLEAQIPPRRVPEAYERALFDKLR